MSTEQKHEYFEHLLVKAVDQALTASESVELKAHLETCGSCAAQLSDFKLIKETTDAMTSRILRDAEIEPPRYGRKTIALLWVSFSLMLAGLLLLGGYTGYTLLVDPLVPMVVKIGCGAAAIGTLGFLLYALRVRVRAIGRDPYKDIDQ